jgi:hypothetical protein
MLTRILHNSSKLCTFFDQLNIDMSKPQRQHILDYAAGLAALFALRNPRHSTCRSLVARGLSMRGQPTGAKRDFGPGHCLLPAVGTQAVSLPL